MDNKMKRLLLIIALTITVLPLQLYAQLSATPSSFAFDPATACNIASTPSCPFPATITSVDAGRGTYGYQPGSITLKNIGASSIIVTSISGTTGFAASSTCVTTIAPNATCKMVIDFAPVDIGAASGTISVFYAGGPITIPVTGMGRLTITNASIPAALPAFYQPVNGLAWSFPVVLVGSSQPTTETITNRGTSNATGLSLTLNEGNSSDITSPVNFSMTTTCGSTLIPNASCTATVTYAPIAAGAHRAMLTILTTNAGSVRPELQGEAVLGLLTKTEQNPDCPVTGAPVYPGGVTVDGPSTLPTNCVNTTDTNINYSGNTIISYTAAYDVCPVPCATTSLGAALTMIQTLANSNPTAACGNWVRVHAQDGSGNQAVYTEVNNTHLVWPTAFNKIAYFQAHGSLAGLPVCTLPNYVTNDHLEKLPGGNRISPAWEGYAMLPGYPPFAWPVGGPGIYVPLIQGNAVNNETIRIPRAVGMKWRFIGLHITGTSGVDEGNTPLITTNYFNDSPFDFPDCIGNPPTSGPNAYICTANDSIVLDQLLVSSTPNWLDIAALDVRGTGISFSDMTHSAIENSYIAGIQCTQPSHCSTDAKAVGPGGSGYVLQFGNKIYNNFLSGATVVVEGGGSHAMMTPSDLIMTNNVLYKPPFYFTNNSSGQLWQPPRIFVTPSKPEQPTIKGCMEFKNLTRSLFEGNVCIHSTNVGQADQFGEAVHFNNINNPFDGLECNEGAPLKDCIGYNQTPPLPTRSPASSFFGVTVSHITFRNNLITDANKCFLIANEFNDHNSFDQILPPIGDLGPISIHGNLCDNVNPFKFGPPTGGPGGRFIAFTVSPPYINPATFGSFCGGVCTWASWTPTILTGANDYSTHPGTPNNMTVNGNTEVVNTKNTGWSNGTFTTPVSVHNGNLGGVGGSDNSNAGVILSATVTSFIGGVCTASVLYLQTAAPLGLAINDKVVFLDTPDIYVGSPTNAYNPLNWAAILPGAASANWKVTGLIAGGFTATITATSCPNTTLNQTNFPLPVFLGMFFDKNSNIPNKYPNQIYTNNIVFGDYSGPICTPDCYSAVWNSTIGPPGYCWDRNMMIPTTGTDTLTLLYPPAFPNCGGDATPKNVILTTYNDGAIGFQHYADGSYWNFLPGGTNDYTVGSTAATYSTTNGPIGFSPAILSTALLGVLDGVTGGTAPAIPVTAPALTMFAKMRKP
jgi:hypothetical protein